MVGQPQRLNFFKPFMLFSVMCALCYNFLLKPDKWVIEIHWDSLKKKIYIYIIGILFISMHHDKVVFT